MKSIDLKKITGVGWNPCNTFAIFVIPKVLEVEPQQWLTIHNHCSNRRCLPLGQKQLQFSFRSPSDRYKLNQQRDPLHPAL